MMKYLSACIFSFFLSSAFLYSQIDNALTPYENGVYFRPFVGLERSMDLDQMKSHFILYGFDDTDGFIFGVDHPKSRSNPIVFDLSAGYLFKKHHGLGLIVGLGGCTELDGFKRTDAPISKKTNKIKYQHRTWYLATTYEVRSKKDEISLIVGPSIDFQKTATEWEYEKATNKKQVTLGGYVGIRTRINQRLNFNFAYRHVSDVKFDDTSPLEDPEEFYLPGKTFSFSSFRTGLSLHF